MEVSDFKELLNSKVFGSRGVPDDAVVYEELVHFDGSNQQTYLGFRKPLEGDGYLSIYWGENTPLDTESDDKYTWPKITLANDYLNIKWKLKLDVSKLTKDDWLDYLNFIVNVYLMYQNGPDVTYAEKYTFDYKKLRAEVEGVIDTDTSQNKLSDILTKLNTKRT